MEAALPAVLLYRAYSVVTEHAGSAGERDKELLAWLWRAAQEPVEGMEIQDKRRLCRRIDRVQAEVMRPYERRPVMLVFLMVLGWLSSLLSSGRLVLYSGSEFDKAVSVLIPALEEHADLWEDMGRSAGKNSYKLGSVLEGMGYYKPEPAWSKEDIETHLRVREMEKEMKKKKR